MSTQIVTADWLKALMEGTNELATSTMGLEAYNDPKLHNTVPDGVSGSCLSLAVDTTSVMLAVMATKDGCTQMAKALLGMGPDDALSDSEVADAVGEVINIVAGGVKRIMSSSAQSIQLGLPIFMSGKIECGENQEAAVADFKIGTIPIKLLIIARK
ncbi:chemotaxis protein CheX [bacterium]|nr:chemotaxis protein CheX [bacterium]